MLEALQPSAPTLVSACMAPLRVANPHLQGHDARACRGDEGLRHPEHAAAPPPTLLPGLHAASGTPSCC